MIKACEQLRALIILNVTIEKNVHKLVIMHKGE